MTRHSPTVLTLCVSLAWASDALAQFSDEANRIDYGDVVARESAQVAAVELRIGKYLPDVDDETPTPVFTDTFGSKKRFIVGLEADWQVVRIPILGTIGPGLGISYTKMSAASRVASTGARSGVKTSLKILPTYLVGVLRADYLARETPVPLVGYGKLGFGYAPWWVTDGQGTATDDAGDKAQGTSWGLHYALGGMLLLDPFDKESALELDTTMGVNNSYVFFEWFVSDLGTANQMHVGDNSWVMGLALEM